MIRSATSSLLVVLLVTAPVYYGSNRELPWSVLALCVGILSLGQCYWRLRAESASSAPIPKYLILAMLGVLAWAFVQIMPVDIGVNDAFLASAAEALNGTPTRHAAIAIDSEKALVGIMRLATYAATFLLAVDLASDARHARALTWAAIGGAVLSTSYGWAMEAVNNSCVVLTTVRTAVETSNRCIFSGTFINSGNYATYVGIASLACLAQLYGRLLAVEAASVDTRTRWRLRLATLSGEGSVYFTALIVLLSGLFYSSSKAGAASFLIAALVMMLATYSSQRRRGIKTMTFLLVIGSFVIAVFVLTGWSVVARFIALLSGGDRDRIELFGLTLQAIRERPWTGWGLGSFAVFYSIFQPSELKLSYDKAHNAYLESAADLGLPASLLLLAIIIVVAAQCLRGLFTRRRNLQYSAAAVGISILVGLHSLVDFGIQMPATAFTFSALLGVGWAQSWSSRHLSD